MPSSTNLIYDVINKLNELEQKQDEILKNQNEILQRLDKNEQSYNNRTFKKATSRNPAVIDHKGEPEEAASRSERNKRLDALMQKRGAQIMPTGHSNHNTGYYSSHGDDYSDDI